MGATELVGLRALQATLGELSAPQPKVDFIFRLPTRLAKRVLHFLDAADLAKAEKVSAVWRRLVREVAAVHDLRREADDFVMDLKATCDPHHSAWVEVPIKVPAKGPFARATTKVVRMFERNVFCGSFSTVSFRGDRLSPNRVAHFGGGGLVVTGAADRQARLWDVRNGKLLRTVTGHAGSIQAVEVWEHEGFFLTASYDTSARMWDLRTGRCDAIFGCRHSGSVVTLAASPAAGLLATGGMDGVLNVWQLPPRGDAAASALQPGAPPPKGRFMRAWHHHGWVTTTAFGPSGLATTAVAAGTSVGDVAVYEVHPTLRRLAFIPKAHGGAVTCIALEEHFLVSGGGDRFVHVRSALPGASAAPITSMRHTAEVLCLKVLCLRVVTGAADGKVRVWSLLSGDCIRIFRGNSKCDPVVGLCFGDNRSLLVNTATTMHCLHFDLAAAEKRQRHGRPNVAEQAAANRLQAGLQQSTAVERLWQYSAAAPVLRNTVAESFSGQWRTRWAERITIEQDTCVSRTVRPAGDESAFKNARLWTLADGFREPDAVGQRISRETAPARTLLATAYRAPRPSEIEAAAAEEAESGAKRAETAHAQRLKAGKLLMTRWPTLEESKAAQKDGLRRSVLDITLDMTQ